MSDLGLKDIINISRLERNSLRFNKINMALVTPTLFNQKTREFLLTHEKTKKYVKNTLNKFIKYSMMVKNSDNLPAETTALRYLLGRTITNGITSLYEKKDGKFRFSDGFRNTFPNAFFKKTFIEGPKRRRKLIKQGKQIVSFVSIDPTSECNLNCEYCYADAGSKSQTYNNEKLSYPDLKRAIIEVREKMGVSFIVLSGGEPTMWKDEKYNKNIADIFEEFNDTFFIMYTNGTKLDDYLVGRISDIGNVILCVSQEGPETSKRRGKGMDKVVDKTTQRLVDHGVPYFYSITVTSRNVDSIADKEFFDYLFEDKRAIGVWIFQCMPIGRIGDDYKAALDLQLKPEQRDKLHDFTWNYIKNEKRFTADFWGSGGAAANKDCPGGCMSAGRNGGYFSIRANGKIIPCLFCSVYDSKLGSLYDIWSKGLDVSAITDSELFKTIRGKQKEISDTRRPCVIRDYEFVEDLVKKGIAIPFDPGTRKLLTDPNFLVPFRNITHSYEKKCALNKAGAYN